VFFQKKNKPRERFYLFPGQGGRNYHHKQRRILAWTVLAALIFSGILVAVMWRMSRP